MHIIEPRDDDTRVTGQQYLSALARHGWAWVGALALGDFTIDIGGRWEYRPVSAINAPLGEYQDV